MLWSLVTFRNDLMSFWNNPEGPHLKIWGCYWDCKGGGVQQIYYITYGKTKTNFKSDQSNLISNCKTNRNQQRGAMIGKICRHLRESSEKLSCFISDGWERDLCVKPQRSELYQSSREKMRVWINRSRSWCDFIGFILEIAQRWNMYQTSDFVIGWGYDGGWLCAFS